MFYRYLIWLSYNNLKFPVLQMVFNFLHTFSNERYFFIKKQKQQKLFLRVLYSCSDNIKE